MLCCGFLSLVTRCCPGGKYTRTRRFSPPTLLEGDGESRLCQPTGAFLKGASPHVWFLVEW